MMQKSIKLPECATTQLTEPGKSPSKRMKRDLTEEQLTYLTNEFSRNHRLPRHINAALFITIDSDPDHEMCAFERQIRRGEIAIQKRLLRTNPELCKVLFPSCD